MPSRFRRHASLLTILLPALFAALLYWPTLRLPLLYDDLLHIRITNELTFSSVWLPTPSFGFYRPFTFLPLLIIQRLFGYYPPALLHALNLAQHALNAALLAWLAWRLWRHPYTALAAGLLLAAFPFSYQAVAVYGHNVHPAAAGLLLLALHTYLTAHQQPGRRSWWLITTLFFIVALLSHESVVLFGPFAFLVQWATQRRNPLRTGRSFSTLLRAPWLIYTLLGLAYLVAFQFLPLSRTPQADFGDVGAWNAKLPYLWQALLYPLSWPAGSLPPSATLPLLLAGTLLLLALLWWIGRQPENRPALLLGLGWWGLASLLVALPLPAGYLLHGPRLLYLSSVGLALLWALLLRALLPLARPLPALLLLLLLAQNILFLRQKLHTYDLLTAPVTLVQETVAGRPPAEGILLVNLPQWLTPARNVYPAGVEIVSMLGDYLFVEELFDHNLRADRPVRAIVLPELLTDPPSYNYGLHNQSSLDTLRTEWAPAGAHVFITHYEETGPRPVYRGFFHPESTTRPPLAHFPAYTLLAATAQSCPGRVHLTLTWEPAAAIPPTTTLFVQLFSADGTMLAQADGPPLGLPPGVLPAGHLIDVRKLALEAGDPAYLLIGEYDYTTGERHPATDPAGNPLPNFAYHLPLRPCN